MAKQNINVGTAANDKKGDSLRAAFQKVNANFTELYEAVGLAPAADQDTTLTFLGSTISTDDSSSIVIDRATTITSNLSVGGNIVPQTANGGDLGSSTLPWRSLYVSGSTIYLGNAALSVDANGELLINNNRILQDNGNYISLNLNVNDVQVSDLQVGDTLQWAGGFWVNGPNGGGGGSTLVNGANTVRLESTGALTLPNGSTIGDGEAGSGVPITTARGTILLGNLAECAGGESHFHIMKGGQQAIDLFLGDDSNYVKLPDTGGVEIATQNFNQYSWIFGTDGNLTIPGDIRSEGNINIDINLSDSTLRRWSFGEDGDLTLAGNIESADVLDITAQSQIRLVSRDDNVQIRTNATSEDTYIWQFGSDGELTLPGGRTRIGTLLGSDAIIANEDTTFAVVTQGTNGAGVLIWIEDSENFGTSNLAAVYINPEGSRTVRIATGANGPGGGPKFWTFNDAGALTFPQGTTFATTDGTGAFIIDGAADKDVQIYTYSGDNARGWTFGTDGSLQIPGDIKSNGNINIDINLADSTLRRWQFGEDGSLRLPIGVSIDDNVDPLYPKIIADSGKLFSIQGQGSTGSAALAWSVNPNADTKYAAVGVSQGGGDNLAKVVMTAGNTTATLKVWKLDETGVFTLPTGGTITDSGNYIKLTPPTGSANQSLLIYPTAGDGNHIHLTAGGGSTELYLGNDIHYVKLVNGGNVEVRANNGVNDAAWTFGTDGKLSLPNNGKIASGVSTAQVGSTTTIALNDQGTDQASDVTYLGIAWTGNESVFTTYAAGSTITFANGDVRTINDIQKNEVYGSPGEFVIDIYWSASRANLTAFPITLKTSNYAAAYTAPEWQFGTNGDLEIPGNIKSEGNINIDINLADSTLRRWQFGEDGDLETPGGIQVAGILKIDDGVHEKFQTKADATGIVTHDCSLGHIFYHTSPDALFTVNFTNLNLSSGYATALTLIIVQGGTGFIPNSVGIGGVIQTLNWQGNVTPTPSTNRTDVVTFSIICTATDTYTVLGQLTGF